MENGVSRIQRRARTLLEWADRVIGLERARGAGEE